MYDIEQFLKEAGAEKINEKAMISLERELQDTVNQLVENALVYANYAGRSKTINLSDVVLAKGGSKPASYQMKYKGGRKARPVARAAKRSEPPKIMLINNIPVIKQGQIISQ